MVNYRERMEDYEIDVKDLLYRIVMKWRQMLVAFFANSLLVTPA